MNSRIFLAAAASASALVFTSCGKKTPAPAAVTQAPQTAVAPPAQEQPVAQDVTAQLKALVEKTRQKIAAGDLSEAAFAEELKGFDALLAANRGNKSDAVAQVALMKALLYFQIIEDYDKSVAVLEQTKADFEGSRGGSEAAALLQQIEAQKDVFKAKAALRLGLTFPDFQAKDLNGAPLSLAQFRGKVVLVDFWATWCGPCVDELPVVQAAYAKFRDKGFEIVGISLDNSEAELKSFLAEHKMTWPQAFDGKGWQSELAKKYGVIAIPATYLLDREGKIVAKNLRGAALDAEISKLLP